MDADRAGFAPGVTLGTHRLERLLGQGAMGAASRACARSSNSPRGHVEAEISAWRKLSDVVAQVLESV
jgi:hypothetical protein